MLHLSKIIFLILVFLLSPAFAEMESTECRTLIEKNQCMEAIRVCKIEAEQGDAKAQTLLGFLYSGTSHGDFRKNYKESFRWISLAAEQDFTKAQLAMAEMYMGGEVVPENAKKAKIWYEKTAKKGNLDGINGLARLYRYGTGVRKDYEKAFELYQQAALQNHTRSQVGVGLSYRDAKGVKKNVIKAYAWLSLAADRMDDRALKDLQKHWENEREEIDKTIPQCKYVLRTEKMAEIFAVSYAKRALFDLKQRMGLKQIKKAKDLMVQLRAEISP